MSKLARRSPAALAVGAELVQAARTYADNALSERTRDAYRDEWATFVGWCEENRLPSLPAAPATVALFLTARAQAGLKVSSLRVALAAIAKAHGASGHPSPRGAEEVRIVMRGIARTVGTAPVRKTPLLAAALRSIVRSIRPGMAGARDKALLLIGFAGAFRRSELVALGVRDLKTEADGLRIAIRRSKTDQEGAGQVVGIPFGEDHETCPVRAVGRWLELARIERGPVFRRVTKAGHVGKARLSDKAVSLIIKRHVGAAGFEIADFSGHSLRAGLATSAAQAGTIERIIQKQTRHESVAMLRTYIRDADLFRENAAKGLL